MAIGAPFKALQVPKFDSLHFAKRMLLKRMLYGPQHAVLYGRYDDLVTLPNQNHFFIEPTRTVYKFQPGNVNYELSYGCVGINDYLVALASRHGNVQQDERAAMAAAFDLISVQEEVVYRRLLDFLNAVPSSG